MKIILPMKKILNSKPILCNQKILREKVQTTLDQNCRYLEPKLNIYNLKMMHYKVSQIKKMNSTLQI